MRVLIGTLHSGENEYDQCVAAMQSQTHERWSHFVIRDRPECEAHDELYRRFMDGAAGNDLFLKLDADMVFTDHHRLAFAVRCFEEDEDLDHAVFRVHDWMTGVPIIGVHVFRSRVRWAKREDPLYPDLPPTITGRRRYFLRPPHSPLAWHSPDPSPLQAFHYGLHRGLKAFNAQRPLYAMSHWRRLRRVWRRFEETRDVRMGLALLAVECVLEGEVSVRDCDYTGDGLHRLFERHASLTADEAHARLAPRWGSAWRRETGWILRLAA